MWVILKFAVGRYHKPCSLTTQTVKQEACNAMGRKPRSHEYRQRGEDLQGPGDQQYTDETSRRIRLEGDGSDSRMAFAGKRGHDGSANGGPA